MGTIPSESQIFSPDYPSKVITGLRDKEWTYIYSSTGTHLNGFVSWTVLASEANAREALTSSGWPVSIGDGNPTYSYTSAKGLERSTYHPLENPEGYEPLIFKVEHHHEAYAEDWEFSQPARLLLGLWKDNENGNLFEISQSAEKEIAVEFKPNFVRIKTRVLDRLQMLRGLHSVHMFESTLEVDSDAHLLPKEVNFLSKTSRIQTYGGKILTYENQFQRMNGVFVCPPKPFSSREAENYISELPDTEFIIDLDENGKVIKASCNPDLLDNYFGNNPGMPHYLTPVFFKRDVLTKYVDNHEIFSYRDGKLWCGGIWSLAIDEKYDNHVMVWLGDLGQYLPLSEHSHWVQFNTYNSESVSADTVRRDILAQWVEDDSEFSSLKVAMRDLDEKWSLAFGERFFNDLPPFDSQRVSTLTFPTNSTHSGIRTPLERLCLLTVESINARPFPKLTENNSSMNRLEAFITQKAPESDAIRLSNLRSIWEIRSKVMTHKVGKEGLNILKELREGDEIRANFIKLVSGVIEDLKKLSIFAAEMSSKKNSN